MSICQWPSCYDQETILKVQRSQGKIGTTIDHTSVIHVNKDPSGNL